MDINQSTLNRSAIGLLILAGLNSASIARASEGGDPHQRAREMIVPSIVYATVSQHVAETPAPVNPHQQASTMMHDDRWPAASMPQPLHVKGRGGVEIDPHRHAQSMIVGHPE